MKNLSILLLLASCLPQILAAQRNFAPLGAEWRFVAGEIEDINCDTHVLLKVESEVEMDGKNCGVIRKYAKFFTEQTFTLTHDSLVVWEEDGRVYFYDTAPISTAQFYLLYDFNLVAGDTLIYYLPHNAEAFGLRNYFIDYYNHVRGPFTNRVTSSSLVNVSGVELRQIETEPIYSSQDSCWGLETIIEKIGCISNGIAGSVCYIVLDYCIGYFVCYQDEDLLLGGNDGMCDFSTAVTWQEDSDGILVFPNPASGEVRLELPAPLSVPARWVLNNALGRQVAWQEIGPGTAAQIVVRLEGLPPGSYFWRLIQEESRVTGRGKLVISK